MRYAEDQGQLGAASSSSRPQDRVSPVLIPLPETPTPRRRRNAVCPKLRVNGEVWTVEDVQTRMRPTLKERTVKLACGNRPTVGLLADWVLDVCMSSWCRDCPFR
ncbi:MAG: hypothetical protein KatS3mg060_0682 [Dehalococcoidia bacterium]|nr:MAG: hypothetical protein KatS3mg060_0682 [Dehalococcoidia bacterium]